MKKESSSQSCSAFYNKTNLLHRSSKPHPQSPERLTTLIDSLTALSKQIKSLSLQEVKLDQGKITREQVQKMLVQLHGEGYWEFVKEMWHQGIKKSQMFINIDTYFMKDTYLAALQAARTTIIAADEMAGEKGSNCFAMVRPPGHHSGLKNQPHGFSFFNNIAMAAEFLIKQKKSKRIAIVDWDVHHGEGTQKLFYNRKDVLFISLHRFDNGKFFPHIQESSGKNIGTGEGTGFNVNVCWNLEEKPKGSVYAREETCGDEEYFYAFEKIVMPILKEFQPEYILVSCGFDSALGDPIGNLALSETGYSVMLQKLLETKKKVLLVLEGGYNKEVLGWAGESIIRALTGKITEQTQKKIQKVKESEPNKIGQRGVQESLDCISKYWTKL